jgi:hypothetical protein
MSLGLVTKIVSAEEFDRHFPTVKPGLLYLSRYEIPNGPNLFSIYVLTYDTESDSYWDRSWTAFWLTDEPIVLDQWFKLSNGTVIEPGEAVEIYDLLTTFNDDLDHYADYRRNEVGAEKRYGIHAAENPWPAIHKLLDLYFKGTPELEKARTYFRAYRWVQLTGIDVAEDV